jgi:O-acetyl-ADP-ribose deacetylase (regulator of RNase III)
MIKYVSGDILRADVEAIVNTVNCVGVMGRGIALQFKKAWPENYNKYLQACNKKQVQPGKMFVFETQQLTNPKYIINFPTKRHWRGASRVEDIESGLKGLKDYISENRISSIAVPPLGCGLGGLEWQTVKQLIEKYLSDLNAVEVIVYEPKGAPEDLKMVRNKTVPKMTSGRAVLIELIQRYLSGLLDPTVSLLEVHKLLYFMQESGEPLRLNYKKAHYGPYAENLRHVFNELEGHYISGYADGGDDPSKPIQLVPGAIDDARNFLKERPETKERFDNVSRLVEGFESPYGLELLSTVHWLKKYENVFSTEDIVEKTHSWNDRKKQFTERQVHLAVNVLSRKKWLSY